EAVRAVAIGEAELRNAVMGPPESVIIADRPRKRLLLTARVGALHLFRRGAVQPRMTPPLPAVGGHPRQGARPLGVPRGHPVADDLAEILRSAGSAGDVQCHLGGVVNGVRPRGAVLARTLMVEMREDRVQSVDAI